MSTPIERRKFISTACKVCAGTVLTGFAMSALTSCAPLPIIKTTANNKKLIIPINSFKLDENKLIVRTDMEFDILLIKTPENKYKALYLKCTHYPNPVMVNKTNLVCPTHGSTYNFGGEVTGEPAIKPLQQFNITTDQENISIQLI
jgi:Rieske Fe-S protein